MTKAPTVSSSASDQQRLSARRTAWWLAVMALGVYAMFIYLGASR